jgi:anti-sigma factor RsiW
MSEHPHAISNEWLALYYDGELDAKRREQVEAHLPTCTACQRELAALKALSGALAGDQMAADTLRSRSARSAWRELEPRLPERAVVASPLLKWLPGMGLLMANVVVQFIAVVGSAVMLVGGQFSWFAQPVAWVNDVLFDWLLGWLTWLLPARWSGWGLSLFLVILTAWLAVLYLAWLGYMWLDRQRPAMSMA